MLLVVKDGATDKFSKLYEISHRYCIVKNHACCEILYYIRT